MAPTDSSAAEIEAASEESSEPLFQLGYVSTQARDMPPAELIELLNFAREANREAGVTGLLLHRKDSFFQVIEGRKEVIEALFARISADSRHRRVEILFQSLITEREFPDWQMGFLDLDQVDVSLLPAYSRFLVDDAEASRFLRELTRGKRLALLFREMPE
jgi:hypothetical protein